MVREVKKRMFKIKQIGNSKGIIIDKDIADFLKLEIGDWVEISIKKLEENNDDPET